MHTDTRSNERGKSFHKKIKMGGLKNLWSESTYTILRMNTNIQLPSIYTILRMITNIQLPETQN